MLVMVMKILSAKTCLINHIYAWFFSYTICLEDEKCMLLVVWHKVYIYRKILFIACQWILSLPWHSFQNGVCWNAQVLMPTTFLSWKHGSWNILESVAADWTVYLECSLKNIRTEFDILGNSLWLILSKRFCLANFIFWLSWIKKNKADLRKHFHWMKSVWSPIFSDKELTWNELHSNGEKYWVQLW